MDTGRDADGAPSVAHHEDAGYRLIAEQVQRYFGLDLTSYRYDQLHRRLLGFARRRNVGDLSQYAQLLAEDAREREGFLHRFAINVSEFFRDAHRFETLEREVLPRILQGRARVRIWSAGCSGGHEAYSIAMLLAERGPCVHTILATDIDPVALAHARAAGPYLEKEIRNVSETRRRRHLRRDEAGHWWVADRLRARVTFQQHDLLRDPVPTGVDMIVCRNVLIYFTAQARTRLFARFAEALRPGGILFVGATEAVSVHQIVDLRPLSFGFYVRDDQRALA